MHGIDIELKDLTSLLELIKFLKFENKDSSQFEKMLLKMLVDMVANSNISLVTKLLVSLVCNSFDDVSGFFDSVS